MARTVVRYYDTRQNLADTLDMYRTADSFCEPVGEELEEALEHSTQTVFTDDRELLGKVPQAGEIIVFFVPENAPKYGFVKWSIGRALWTEQWSFRNQCTKELSRILRHVITPKVTILIRHTTLGGQIMGSEYVIGSSDLANYGGMDSVATEKIAGEIVDKNMMNFIDQMSFQILPTLKYASSRLSTDVSVPKELSAPIVGRLVADAHAPDRLQSAVDDMKSELETIRDQMYAMAKVPADRMNQDYADAEKILAGDYEEFIGKKKERKKDGIFDTPKTSWAQ